MELKHKEYFSNEVLPVFKNLQNALDRSDFDAFCFKPQQIQCWKHLLDGKDVIAILPTGFGKSAVFQLLSRILPTQDRQNIVVVVSPLNSIIDDQMKFLNQVGISCGKMNLQDPASSTRKLFADATPPIDSIHQDEVDVANEDEDDEDIDFTLDKIKLPSNEESTTIPTEILEGRCEIVFGHPEAILSPAGRKVLGSEVYQKNVVAITIDEAHCVETW
jgi:superfamily II DNA helicase RecQ